MSVTHATTATGTDAGNGSIHKAEWNAAHTVSIAESDLSLSDVTTANVSTSKHGFAPKGDGSASHYLDGTGAYSTPASGSPFLAESVFKQGSDTAINTTSSATLGDIDATNCIITFTAPASGHVLVMISCLAGGTGGAYLGLREGTNQVGTQAYLGGAVSTSTLRNIAHFDVTGVSAGSHTYKAAFKATSGTMSVYGGPTFGDFVMTVANAG